MEYCLSYALFKFSPKLYLLNIYYLCGSQKETEGQILTQRKGSTPLLLAVVDRELKVQPQICQCFQSRILRCYLIRNNQTEAGLLEY